MGSKALPSDWQLWIPRISGSHFDDADLLHVRRTWMIPTPYGLFRTCLGVIRDLWPHAANHTEAALSTQRVPADNTCGAFYHDLESTEHHIPGTTAPSKRATIPEMRASEPPASRPHCLETWHCISTFRSDAISSGYPWLCRLMSVKRQSHLRTSASLRWSDASSIVDIRMPPTRRVLSRKSQTAPITAATLQFPSRLFLSTSAG
ncbi:hypothetical protein IWX90DRAFT_18383 [Phyllosticta citrichinensis]|uniref:Uncharacterized protein n=1 Tax=Phyllosticta citrichinensis TaxID=1130410 RepID=A0ABR1Y6M5_9PEZI